MTDIHNKIKQSIELLDNWLFKNGWAGWDPYDLQCKLFYKQAKKNKLIKKLHVIILKKSNQNFPLFSRKLIRIKPKINAKGMGLFLSAYCNLYKITNDERYLQKAYEISNWLLDNPNKEYDNLCWGYPFDWQSKIFIPKGTPSSVVTSHIGHGFWDLYSITSNEKYLEVCKSICKFFLESLNQSKTDAGICFSYTPLDDFQVHNANLFVAEFLIRMGKAIKIDEWIQIGLKAVDFSLAEQNTDGSLCYWSSNQEHYQKTCSRDHYHSGFEIRMLNKIWKNTGIERIKKAVNLYYSFYVENYFADDFAPILQPKGDYNIDIHSCSEVLICNSELINDFPKAKQILEESINWIIKNMQMPKGWFRYSLRKVKNKINTIDIPYIRWGQAWMLLGLVRAYQTLR